MHPAQATVVRHLRSDSRSFFRRAFSPFGHAVSREHQHLRSRSSARGSTSRIELYILGAGLVAAVASGIIAYQIVGPYGDGPFGGGFRRIPNPETGGSMLVHEFVYESEGVQAVVHENTGRLSELRLDADADGTQDTRAHLEGTAVVRVERDQDGDGDTDLWEYYDDAQQLEKIGFSLSGDGVLDAWAYYGQDGQLTKIEVSTARDGTVNRWEFYENGSMVRVEEDTSGDGQADRWSTYANGILSLRDRL